mgnify:CR=1 FL=1
MARKESKIQKAERLVRQKSHEIEERSFLIDMLMHIECYDEDSDRMQKLHDKIEKLVEEWNAEYNIG